MSAWAELLDLPGDQMIALDAHTDAHRRADATAVHHFTASPGPARHAAHVQGIIEYSVAGVGDHRGVGAIAILALKLSEVGDILQVTSPVQRLERKRPVRRAAVKIGRASCRERG